jgi:hypothetical protein
MRVQLLLALPLALAVASCGNRQSEAAQEFRSRCNALVPGTTTLIAASQSLSQNAIPLPCQNNFAPIGSDDVCPYVTGQTQICELVYEFIGTDCSGPGGGGTCADYCLVRVATTSASSNTPICARQVLRGQPIL